MSRFRKIKRKRQKVRNKDLEYLTNDEAMIFLALHWIKKHPERNFTIDEALDDLERRGYLTTCRR